MMPAMNQVNMLDNYALDTDFADETTYRVRLTKIHSSNKNIRTESVEGITKQLPTEGHAFLMTADPIDPLADIRLIQTTVVESVESVGNEYRFYTRNSYYKLEVLEVLNGHQV